MYEMHSCIHTLVGGMTFKVSLKVKGLNTSSVKNSAWKVVPFHDGSWIEKKNVIICVRSLCINFLCSHIALSYSGIGRTIERYAIRLGIHSCFYFNSNPNTLFALPVTYSTCRPWSLCRDILFINLLKHSIIYKTWHFDILNFILYLSAHSLSLSWSFWKSIWS